MFAYPLIVVENQTIKVHGEHNLPSVPNERRSAQYVQFQRSNRGVFVEKALGLPNKPSSAMEWKSVEEFNVRLGVWAGSKWLLAVQCNVL